MTYHIGQKLKGRITGIQPYGAFVMLDDHTQGLIHISECNFGLNLSCIEDINDPKCLGKEPLKFRGFRVEKRRRKFRIFWGGGWGAAPLRAP